MEHDPQRPFCRAAKMFASVRYRCQMLDGARLGDRRAPCRSVIGHMSLLDPTYNVPFPGHDRATPCEIVSSPWLTTAGGKCEPGSSDPTLIRRPALIAWMINPWPTGGRELMRDLGACSNWPVGSPCNFGHSHLALVFSTPLQSLTIYASWTLHISIKN